MLFLLKQTKKDTPTLWFCVGVSFCKIDLEVFLYFHHIINLINFIYKINNYKTVVGEDGLILTFI